MTPAVALERGNDWARSTLLTESVAIQLGAVVVTFLVAWLLARRLVPRIAAVVPNLGGAGRIARLRAELPRAALPLLWLLLIGSAAEFASGLDGGPRLLDVATRLVGAWLVIRLASAVLLDPGLATAIAAVAWTIAALSVLGLLEATVAFLDALAIQLGDVRLSVYLLLKGALLATLLLWLASLIGAVFQRRIERLPNLTPSARILVAQTLRLFLVVTAILITLGSIGIDLTALTVFGGAVGVGVGFGLQKVVANLVSGIILLLERSIKPGDVIELDGTYGTVNSLGARYASIVTGDGKEYLVPNENLITQTVINWSYSDNLVRQRLPISIALDSDVDLATRLMIEAACETARVLPTPAPVSLMKAFGEKSIDFELRFWIGDPQNGRSNVADAILRRLWRKFQESGIGMPSSPTEVVGRIAIEDAARAGSAG